MTDYIKREDALEQFDYYDLSEYLTTQIRGMLMDVPSADVAPVVRCKDCKYGEVDDSDFPTQYLCEYRGSDWNNGDHFCSYGEREDNVSNSR